MEPHNDLFVCGNAVSDGQQDGKRGWFVGYFITPSTDVRCVKDVEVKWGTHVALEEKETPSINNVTTLTLLVSGSFCIIFSDINQTIFLNKPGDYVMFKPGVSHHWKALSDSIVITVRWPSIFSDA